jgi:hypothetical protein
MSMYVAADDYSLSPLLSLVIAGPLDMVDMEDRVLPDTVPRGHNIAISNYQGGEKEFQTFCFPVKFAVQRSPTRNFGQRRRTAVNLASTKTTQSTSSQLRASEIIRPPKCRSKAPPLPSTSTSLPHLRPKRE